MKSSKVGKKIASQRLIDNRGDGLYGNQVSIGRNTRGSYAEAKDGVSLIVS